LVGLKFHVKDRRGLFLIAMWRKEKGGVQCPLGKGGMVAGRDRGGIAHKAVPKKKPNQSKIKPVPCNLKKVDRGEKGKGRRAQGVDRGANNVQTSLPKSKRRKEEEHTRKETQDKSWEAGKETENNRRPQTGKQLV